MRHGETEWNREGRIQGHNDGALNERGRRQAEAVGLALRLEHPTAVYASPLSRARQTAEAIASACHLSVVPVEALVEADAGELDGLKGSEMQERYPEFMQLWRQDAATAVMPGGESMAQVQLRVWGAVANLLRHHTEDTVVAVSHNFAIQSLLCRALGVPLNNFRRFRIDLGAFSILEFREPGPMLVRHNERCHLQGLDTPPAG